MTQYKKNSLYLQRFGVTIYFGGPSKKEFQNIVVSSLAQKAGIQMNEEELLLQANQWELSHGGLRQNGTAIC